MKRKKSLFYIIGGITVALMLTTTAVFSSSDFGVSKSFKESDKKVEAIKDKILVATPDFNITTKEFAEYKENLKFTSSMNGGQFKMKDEEIIDHMLSYEMLIQHAKKQNLTVTKEEVLEQAMQTKEAIEQSPDPQMHSIHAALSEKLNVSLDDYFTHPDTLKEYERYLMYDKAYNHLLETGELNDNQTLEDMVLDFKEQSAVEIKTSELDSLK